MSDQRPMPTFYDMIDRLIPPDRLDYVRDILESGNVPTEEDLHRTAALQAIDVAQLGRAIVRESLNHAAQMLYVDESIQMVRKDAMLDLHAEVFGYERDKVD